MPTGWQVVTELPSLASDELQLWQVRLCDAPTDPHLYRKHLSGSELERADRLRTSTLRLEFTAARAALRVLLGNLLRLAPGLVPLTLSPYGKPETVSIDGLPLFFNVAHSRETILIILCRSSPVGIDVEYLDRSADVLEIARTSFAPREADGIMRIGDALKQQHAFFRCWTRKEAVIKADGRGLSIPLKAVEVPISGPAVSAAVSIKEEPGQEADSRPWFVTDIALGEEIAAAFAVRMPKLTPTTFNFPVSLLSDL